MIGGLGNLIIFFLSFIIILAYLYLRFTKKLYIIELTPQGLAEYYIYIVYLLLITLSVLCILLGEKKYTWLKRYKENTNKKKSIFTIFGEKLQKWLSKITIFKWLYNVIFNALGEFSVEHTIKLARKVVDFTHKQNIIIILSFVTLPRLIILFILILEIYLGRINYYFYSLYLLIIPQVFNLILYMLTDIGPRALLDLKELVIQENISTAPTVTINTPDGPKTGKAVGFRLHPDYPNQNLDILMFEFYYPMLFIKGLMPDVNRLTAKVKKYTLFVYYIIHVLGFIYILYFLT